jgi:hypothetical protein
LHHFAAPERFFSQHDLPSSPGTRLAHFGRMLAPILIHFV